MKRVLNPFELVLFGIGAVVGTGIFVITGVAAANFAGPVIVVSFVIAGVVCLFAALCYAEFAARVPVARSAYIYSYASLGEIQARIIGWDLFLEYSVAVAAVAIGWSGYVVNLLAEVGITLPAALVNPPGVAGGLINLPAVLIVAAITLLLILGVKGSTRINTVIVVIKIAVILLFLYLGYNRIDPANWDPFRRSDGAGSSRVRPSSSSPTSGSTRSRRRPRRSGTPGGTSRSGSSVRSWSRRRSISRPPWCSPASSPTPN